jgi:hypothetical protein
VVSPSSSIGIQCCARVRRVSGPISSRSRPMPDFGASSPSGCEVLRVHHLLSWRGRRSSTIRSRTGCKREAQSVGPPPVPTLRAVALPCIHRRSAASARLSLQSASVDLAIRHHRATAAALNAPILMHAFHRRRHPVVWVVWLQRGSAIHPGALCVARCSS